MTTRATDVVRLHETGASAVLRYEQAEVEAPAAGHVLVRQEAVGVNVMDLYMRNGVMPVPGLPVIPGLEAAGTLEAVGEGVEGWAPGDRVGYLMALGAYAGLRAMPADRLVRLPAGLGAEDAAALLLKGVTAELLLRRVRHVGPEDVVLIQGAAGGVGLILCQWASHLGATVIAAVGSDEKAALARANGAHHAIITSREDLAAKVAEITGGAGATVAYDGVGRATFKGSLDSLRPFGQAVLFGWSSGRVEPMDPHALGAKSLTLTAPSLRNLAAAPARLQDSVDALLAAVASGAVRRPVVQRYPLSAAVEAHADLEARRTQGSVILIPAAV